MSALALENNPDRAARVAGLLYVLIAIFGGFAIGYVPSVVFTFGDASANAASMLANEGLLRLGIFADMMVIVFEVTITAILYTLFRPVSAAGAMIAMLARFGMIVVMALNLVNYLVPLHLLSGAEYLGGFSQDELQAWALMFLEIHEMGVYAWQIFFGVHLVALGWLVLKSGFFPRILGWAVIVGSFGYSLQSVEKFVLPGNEPLGFAVIGLLTIVTLGEVSLGLWMLIRGVGRKAGAGTGRLAAA